MLYCKVSCPSIQASNASDTQLINPLTVRCLEYDMTLLSPPHPLSLILPYGQYPPDQTRLQSNLMNATRPRLIIFLSRHEPFTNALIDDEDHFRRDLGAQKDRLFETDFFPLGEIFRCFDHLDTGGRLTV